MICRPRVVPLPLSPSRATVNKPRGKNDHVKPWGRDARASRPQEFTRPFFLAVFFRVKYDGLSVIGTYSGLDP